MDHVPLSHFSKPDLSLSARPVHHAPYVTSLSHVPYIMTLHHVPYIMTPVSLPRYHDPVSRPLYHDPIMIVSLPLYPKHPVIIIYLSLRCCVLSRPLCALSPLCAITAPPSPIISPCVLSRPLSISSRPQVPAPSPAYPPSPPPPTPPPGCHVPSPCRRQLRH